MLLRGFEMRRRSQGSETFLLLNAEKREGDGKVRERGGRVERQQLSGSTWQPYGFTHRWGEGGIQRELFGSYRCFLCLWE